MKVEVDADELCELKRSADKNNMWDYHKVCYDSLKKKYDILDKELTSARNECDALRMMVKESAFHKLRDERDFWRDAALSYETTIFDSVRILDEGPLYSSTAEKLGYEVPE